MKMPHRICRANAKLERGIRNETVRKWLAVTGVDAAGTAVDAPGSGSQVQRDCQEPAETKCKEEGGTCPDALHQELPANLCRTQENTPCTTFHGPEPKALPNVSGLNMNQAADVKTITHDVERLRPGLAASRDDDAAVQSKTPSAIGNADHVSCDDLAQQCLGLS